MLLILSPHVRAIFETGVDIFFRVPPYQSRILPLSIQPDIISSYYSPNRYWLCAATGPVIKIWDLESKNMVEELKPEVPSTGSRPPVQPQCLSMAWSADGQTLFAGYSDNKIRVWQVVTVASR